MTGKTAFARRDPQTRVAQRVDQFAGGYPSRPARHQAIDGIFGHVVVIEVEPAPGDTVRRRERVKFGQIVVAHEVSPETTMRWPPRRVDQDGHPQILTPTRGVDAFAASRCIR